MPTTIPAGWKLVPIEPTDAMLDAGIKQHRCEQGDPWYSSPDLGEGDCREIYAAMLNAAPAAPSVATAGNPQPARDWELTCHKCDGSGHVYVKHQVAERKTDIQEFKEECECCEGRGFVFAFQDIPGIEEYVKACRPAPAAGNAQTAAARDVLAERQRQVEVKQYEPDADDNYEQCELAYAAAAYAITPGQIPPLDLWAGLWPWSIEVFKPTGQRRNLVKAGALILAEIERLDRAAQRKGDA
ncbi:hypothetical protein [Achromobacter xylosoxidans]|uniref:hypothetical protein n=1 Tax=Alcaligenes xylosoxydans xylosoxydans TaxID=85698 RepID=UPI001F1292FC|nr:hypothetical protein [Achromobacter xylosoxidans]